MPMNGIAQRVLYLRKNIRVVGAPFVVVHARSVDAGNLLIESPLAKANLPDLLQHLALALRDI